ncbi:pyridoxamine 5'-phosphate oxidase family protein [Paractinoplanes abujensis]|nr:pyridoxamine 5'-phosphate oxidase family protein [Actinoplanes abujensis]
MHRLLRVPYEENPTIRGLPMAYALWMAETPLLALGTVDRHDRIWTTVLGGAPGVTRPVAPQTLGVHSPALARPGFDPVLEALRTDDGRPEKLVAGLAIDLEQRTRVKIAGRVRQSAVQATQIAVTVDETLGNCPKYLNRKAVRPHEASPQLVSDALPLPPEAVDLIARADIFFLSSRHGTESMDTNNRGGAPGFVRVRSNSDDEGVTLIYPEYSGNRLYQTLGNLRTDPAVGMTFPDFETGDVLYLTGRAEVLIGAGAAAVLPHSKIAVRVTVEAARFVTDGLPFRGRLLDPSPYNPPVRRLARESAPLVAAGGKAVARLLHKHPVTPTITRYTFRLSPDPAHRLEPWRAGQHVTLDFSARLDRGWSHMRDHDPRSLNDDYVRTFTISSPPPLGPHTLDGVAFDITVRRNGPATGLLARWTPLSTLDVTVLGFGGGARYADTPAGSAIVVVAAGVGITPLMAQAPDLLRSGRDLRLLWTLRAADLPLAADVLERIDGLAAVTTLFVTGPAPAVLPGVAAHTRRITKTDVLNAGVQGRRRFHVCACPQLRDDVLGWVEDEPVRSESFDY